MRQYIKKYKENRKNLSVEEIINVLILSIVIIMPFIVTNLSSTVYMNGKVYFLYVVNSIILISVMKIGKSIMGKEEKISYWFLISILIATIFSEFSDIVIWGNQYRLEGIISISCYILLFIVSIRYVQITQPIKIIILSIPSIMSIIGILQFYKIDPIAGLLGVSVEQILPVGLIGHRNFFATYILIFLIFNFSAFILRGKLYNLINSIIQFSALLCTTTRGCWIAFFVVSMIGILYIFNDKRKIKRAIAVFLIFVSVFAVLNITSNGLLLGKVDNMIEDIKDITPDSGSYRVDIWMRVCNVIKRSPIIGSGPDTLLYKMAKYHQDDIQEHFEKYDQIPDKAHNEYLEYWVSDGIVTLITYLWLLSVIGYNLLKGIKDDKYKILFLTFIAYIVQAFFNISVPMVAPIWWIFLGYCVKTYRQERKIDHDKVLIETNLKEAK